MLTSAFAATLACANLGDLRGALDRLAMLERLLAEVEDRFYHARAATTGSWLWRELGDLGRSRALAERALDLLGPAATGTHPGLHAQLALAETALVAGDEAAAAGFLERAGGQLERPFGYRWRVELRHAELASRLDPPAAEALLELARTYGSTKYQALALARLGRRPEAAGWPPPPAPTTSWPRSPRPPQARAALDRIAAGLPAELRPAFLERGHLARAVPVLAAADPEDQAGGPGEGVGGEGGDGGDGLAADGGRVLDQAGDADGGQAVVDEGGRARPGEVDLDLGDLGAQAGALQQGADGGGGADPLAELVGEGAGGGAVAAGVAGHHLQHGLLGEVGGLGPGPGEHPDQGATRAISARAAPGSGKWLMPNAQPAAAKASSRNGSRSASPWRRAGSGLWRSWAADRSRATAAGSSRPSAPDPAATSSTGPAASARARASGRAR